MPVDDRQVAHAPWSRHATLYELNVRQFTPAGTLAALHEHLPRLRGMGVDILWLMPIHPVGRQARKGTLGSPYAVADHLAVDPALGTPQDFRALVDAIHAHGMKVILDWVANHTAWDHPWVSAHPEWYLKGASGQLEAYAWDNNGHIERWSDVVGLDYSQPPLWSAMIAALCWWVAEMGVDGYRCDVAGLLPTPFWTRARTALQAIRPVFMLAEWDDPVLHHGGFDASYDWRRHDAMKAIARGEADATALQDAVQRDLAAYPADAYRLSFTSNHDKNAWEGHDAEVFGPSFQVFAVLAVILPGLPLVYGGQEAALDRRLAFFERDTIDWKDRPLEDFYTRLFGLKHRNRALANGAAGGPVQWLDSGNPSVLALRRTRDGDSLALWANLSALPQRVMGGESDAPTRLEPWSWRLVSRCSGEVLTWI